jgi:hypothetical protein
MLTGECLADSDLDARADRDGIL